MVLRDFVDVKKWQKIQDNFSAVTGVGLHLINADGASLTTPSREPRLCSELINNPAVKKRVCGPCLPTFLGGKGVLDKNLSFTCHVAGLHNFLAPLRVDGNILGYFMVGPVVLGMRKPKNEYHNDALELDLDLDDFWNALLEIKVVSFHCIQSLLELIQDLGEYNLKLYYQSKIKEKELVMSLDSPKLTRFLDALLDVAFEMSGADVGSIMFFDDNSQELTIRASKGLPEDIVKNTRVKLGSHLSGIAAKEGRAFLIDENTKDNRIKPYLNRPYLSSSIIIPLKAEDSVVGVMNIGTLNTSSVRFNDNNLRLMSRLVDLAALAIRS